MAGLKAAEQQKSKKRSASAPLVSEIHKVHRLSTEGKPPRRAFSLSLVPVIKVSGCVSKTVNGIYKRDGEYKGTPKFSREGNGFYVVDGELNSSTIPKSFRTIFHLTRARKS